MSDLLDSDAPGGGNGEIDRARALRLTRVAAATAREVEAALRRLDPSAYGTCETCDQRIPLARLRVLPETTMCVTCMQATRPPLAVGGVNR